MKKQCANCAHWGDEDDENGYGVKFSRCHRFPPVVVPDDVRMYGDMDEDELKRLGKRNMRFDFPWVSENQVCGEFKSSNAKLSGAEGIRS